MSVLSGIAVHHIFTDIWRTACQIDTIDLKNMAGATRKCCFLSHRSFIWFSDQVKGFKGTIKAMERQAEKTLFLESVLKDYIEEEFLVEKYEARKTDYLEYAVFCRFTGSSDVHVFNIFIKDEEVVKVTKKYTVPSKKKGGIPKCTWKEVRPIERKTD